MSHSDYCYVHSLGHFKKVPLWKNLTNHLLSIIAIISFLLAVYSFKTGATKTDIDQIRDKMDRYYNSDNERLLRSYPAGYALFAIDNHKQLIVPDKNMLLGSYDIHLQNLRITEVSKEYITFYLSMRYFKEGKFDQTLRDILIRTSRTEGPKKVIQLKDLQVFLEILEDNNDGTIILIGLKKDVNYVDG